MKTSRGKSLTRFSRQEMVDEETKFYINPTGRFVIGGPHGDAGRYRTKDHRRHLRRICPPRRRSVLWKGLHEGGPLCGLCGTICGQEHRSGRPGRQM